MKKIKVGLLMKFTALFLSFAVIVFFTVGVITYDNFEEALMQRYTDEAVTIANLAASYLDGDEVVRYSITREPDEEYERLKGILDNIKEQSGVHGLYVIMPVSDHSTIHIFDAQSLKGEPFFELGHPGEWDDNFLQAKEAMATGETNTSLEATEGDLGYLYSTYAPIKDSTGQPVAVVGVDFSVAEIQTVVNESLRHLLRVMVLVIVGGFVFLLLLVYRSIIFPIRLLKNRVERMADGELGVQVPVKSRDEIGEISAVFNRMSHNISGHFQEITELNEGYYKFVPSVIFKILNKKTIRDIKLGDNRKVPLDVLCMQVNDFDEQTRKMDSEELFGFVNRVYQLCVPQIIEKHGVVVDYQNGGLSAIYTEIGKNALESAINICQKLNLEKKQQKDGGLKEIELAFGISKGSQMVGIVGHDQRLSAVTMSEQISLIDYLRRIAWKYSSRILITGSAVNAIPNFSERYHSRLIGVLHISASDSLEKLYDVYDGDEDSVRELKEMTKAKFEEGVACFMAQRFYEARLCFVEVLKVFQGDFAAREYLYLCNEYYTREETSDIDAYIEDF